MLSANETSVFLTLMKLAAFHTPLNYKQVGMS